MPFLLTAFLVGILTPLTSLSGLLMIAGGGRALRRSPSVLVRSGTLGMILLGWLLWLPLSMFWSLSPGVALTYIAVLLCLPLAWLTVAAARDHASSLLDWLLPFVLAVMVLWAVLQGPDTFTAKPQGPFNDPNVFAAFLNLLLLPGLARWLAADLSAQRPLWRTAQLALLAAGLFATLLANSRGGTLVLLAASLLLLWQTRTLPHAARKRRLLLAVAAVAFLATAQLSTVVPNVAQRLANTVLQGDAGRLLLTKSALAMIADHPWLGTGIGSFQLLYAQYRAAEETGTAGGWVHNDYLQLWQEAGLPMFLLLLALLLWVARRCWRVLKEGSPEQARRLGYLLAVLVVLVHATVNFLLYFAPIMLLVGTYLAIADTPGQECAPETPAPGGAPAAAPITDPASKHHGAFRLSVIGYVLIVGYLVFGQAAVEYMLGDGRHAQRLATRLNVTYQRHEVAYWLSVLTPFNPTPQQVLAFDTVDSMVLSGGGLDMLDEALSRMEASIRLVPCYQPFANAALSMLAKEKLNADLIARGERIVKQSLACGPHHALTYYYGGVLDSMKPGGDPLQKWIKGLTMTNNYGEQLLLATAIMVVTQPAQEKVLIPLAKQMAQDLKLRESRPGVMPEPYFWVEAHRKLEQCCGTQYVELIKAAGKVVVRNPLP